MTKKQVPAEGSCTGKRKKAGHQAAQHAKAEGKIRILLADDHAVLRQGLALLLREEPDLEVVGTAPNGQVAVEEARLLEPDVIVMDVSMPVMNGIEATSIITFELPGIRVIGLSMHEDEKSAHAMLEAGATAFLQKSGSVEGLITAIRAACAQDQE